MGSKGQDTRSAMGQDGEDYLVQGEKIRFPYQAYQMQLVLIARAVAAIQQKKNALLESPTGTGKTIAILSGVLAWKEHHADISCQVLYASRTHSQLHQLVSEVKRSPHRHTFSSVCLASRTHYCLHPRVSKEPNINLECKKARTTHRCSFFNQVEKAYSKVKEEKLHLDIEDVVGVSKRISDTPCPYYLSRRLSSSSSLVFCPYNYILRPSIRNSSQVTLENSILILDEAHNVEDVCREAASLDLPVDALERMSAVSLESVRASLADECRLWVMDSDTREELKMMQLVEESLVYHPLHDMMERIMRWLDNSINQFSPQREMISFDCQTQYWPTFKTQEIVGNHFGIDQQRLNLLRDAVTEAETLATKMMENGVSQSTNSPQYLTATALEHLASLLDLFQFMHAQPDNMDAFHVVLQRQGKLATEYNFQFSVWCMDPAIAFQQLTVCRSVIVMSGTLAPMNSFSRELGTEFPLQLEARHIVPPSHTWIETVGRSSAGKEIKAHYQNTDSVEFQDAIGDVVYDYCSSVPDGVLCFLPSYRLLHLLVDRWKTTRRWNSLQSKKALFIEPTRLSDLPQMLEKYYAAIEDGHGALLLAVCRGKVSEGINFADRYARAVLVVGIPFPNLKDPQVILKKAYNNRKCHGTNQSHRLTGKQWYTQQAFRALNQALGRCIRHAKDYGAIVLVDVRYSDPAIRSQVSKWIRERIRPSENNGAPNLAGLRAFFQQHEPLRQSATPRRPLPSATPRRAEGSSSSSSLSKSITEMYKLQKSTSAGQLSTTIEKKPFKLPKASSTSSPLHRPPSLYPVPSLSAPVKEEEVPSLLPPRVQCHVCRCVLSTQEEEPITVSIHWNEETHDAWQIPTLRETSWQHAPGDSRAAWIPEDAMVYEPIYCGQCSSTSFSQPLGVKIVATAPSKQSVANQFLLFHSQCQRGLSTPVSSQKRSFLAHSYATLSKRMKTEPSQHL